MARPTDCARRPTITRTELLWLVGAVLVGVVLRVCFLSRIAIEHFDEGVYASNFWFSADQGYEYPARYLYAPPLLPALIEWTMILASLLGLRPTGWVPVIPCLVAGAVAIPSVWWICRHWFGPVSGVVSAWFVATSDFHASYSRAALTDVPVCLLMLWGVYFSWKAIQAGAARDVLLAGLFTGLAWSTKYNGWFPLAVGLAGGTAAQLHRSARLPEFLALGRRWLLVVCVSGLVWSPVLIGLQRHGGYRAVAANHQQYVGRIDRWGANAVRQLRNIGTYDSLLTWAGESLSNDVSTVQWWLAIASPLVLFVVSLVAVASWLRRNRHLPEQASSGWLALAWLGGLTAATPMYHPYPRLALPWLIGIWMAVGLAIQLLTERTGSAKQPPAAVISSPANRWISATVAWLLAFTVARGATGSLHCWQDRAELARAVESTGGFLKAQARDAGFPEEEVVAYVYGDPAIVFGLKANHLSLVGPVQNLDFLSTPRVRPTFLIRTDRMAPPASFQDEWTRLQSDFSLVLERPTHVSHLVRLDAPPTRDARPNEETIEVYRVR